MRFKVLLFLSILSVIISGGDCLKGLENISAVRTEKLNKIELYGDSNRYNVYLERYNSIYNTKK